jgi:hypothetical protein
MNLKNEIEPRMNTDQTRINNFAYAIQVSLNPCAIHGFIRVNPCSSVANRGS